MMNLGHYEQLSEWLVIAVKTPIHTSWKYWFRLFSWGWVKQVWTNAHPPPFSAYYRQELTSAVGNGNSRIATRSCGLKICPCLYCLVFQQCSATARHKPAFYSRKKKGEELQHPAPARHTASVSQAKQEPRWSSQDQIDQFQRDDKPTNNRQGSGYTASIHSWTVLLLFIVIVLQWKELF